MAAETLDVQYSGNGGYDSHEPPVDFFDPDRLLRRRDGLVTGALGEFGVRELVLREFDPDRENTGAKFGYLGDGLGKLGLLSLHPEDGKQNLN